MLRDLKVKTFAVVVLFVVAGAVAFFTYRAYSIEDYRVIEAMLERSCVEIAQQSVKSPDSFKVIRAFSVTEPYGGTRAINLNDQLYGDAASAHALGIENIKKRNTEELKFNATTASVEFSSQNPMGVHVKNRAICEFVQSPAFLRPELFAFHLGNATVDHNEMTFLSLESKSDTFKALSSPTSGLKKNNSTGKLEAPFLEKLKVVLGAAE